MARGHLKFAIILAIISSVALAPVPVHATSSSNGTGTSAQHYTDAAISAKEGAKKDKMLAGVWGLVAAYCTLPCINPMMFSYAVASCQIGGMAAGVTDALVTKQYASALTSITMSGMSIMLSGGLHAMPKDKSAGRMGACMTLASSALQVFLKLQTAKNSDSTADENTRIANSHISAAPSTDGATLATSGSVSNTAPPSGSGTTQASNSADPCSGASSSSGVSTQISCAVASDSSLPPFIQSTHFPEEFKKMTGKDPSDFLNAVQNGAGNALASNTHLDGDAAGKLKNVLDSMEQYAADDLNSGIYAGGGGGGGSGGGGGEHAPDFGALMSGLMAQLNPQAEKEEVPPGFSADDVAQMRRSPAQVTENKTLSIFARVSYRYYYVGRRMLYSDAPRQQNSGNQIPTGGTQQ